MRTLSSTCRALATGELFDHAKGPRKDWGVPDEPPQWLRGSLPVYTGDSTKTLREGKNG